jgi:arabinogalactan oligomer / maltooligosaccharide transport system substrate-binding protein
MKLSRRFTALLALAGVGVLAAVAATVTTSADARTGGSASAQGSAATVTVRIWTDSDRKAAVERVAGNWARSRGVAVEVVQKQFGDIRDNLKTVKAENAPDVIVAAHDWTGELAANGLVVPLVPKKSALKPIPLYARQAFSYGKTTSRLYGMPVTLENVGLFVNTKVAKVPKSFSDLEKQALKFQKKGGGRIGLAIQQGSGGDTYHMYSLFSGLCGYIFGRTSGGSLNPNDLGVANKRFLKNAPLIDKWNKEGLVNSKIDGGAAQAAFTSGKAAFWVTGPWNIDTIRKANIKFKIVQMPRIKCRSVPFLGVNGFMVTRFANVHGVASAAKDLVGNYMAATGAQLALANANGRYPANKNAGKRVTDSALKAIGRAGAGGVAMPNIPQMNSVWTDLNSAWVKSTKGSGATKARTAFTTAARNIRAKLNSG